MEVPAYFLVYLLISGTAVAEGATSREPEAETWTHTGISSFQTLTTTTKPEAGKTGRPEQEPSVKFELTFHAENVSWNTASNVCKASGSSLVQITTQEKSDAIQYFTHNHWQGVIEMNYWIGLFDGDIPNMRYTWTDCTLMKDEFMNWYDSGSSDQEPNRPDWQHCVAQHRQGGHWATRPCPLPYQFICEKTIGECTYSSLEGMTFLRTRTTYACRDLYNTIEECQAECSLDHNSRERCWAVSYGNRTCCFHPASSPFSITFSQAQVENGFTASVRICYTAAVDGSNVGGGLIDESYEPSVSCEVAGNLMTSQPRTDLEVRSNTPEPKGTDRSSVELFTVTSTGKYSATEDRPTYSVNSLEQSAIPVSPSPSSVDMTMGHSTMSMWSGTDACAGSTCPVIIQHKTIVVSETSNALETTSLPDRTTVSEITSPPEIATETETATLSETTSLPDISIVAQTVPVGPGEEQLETLASGLCRCPCSKPLSKEESAAIMSSILGEMIVIDRKNVLSYKSKHKSAPDDRPSAQSIGYFGAVILGVIFGAVVLQDLPGLHNDMKAMIHNLRERD